MWDFCLSFDFLMIHNRSSTCISGSSTFKKREMEKGKTGKGRKGIEERRGWEERNGKRKRGKRDEAPIYISDYAAEKGEGKSNENREDGENAKIKEKKKTGRPPSWGKASCLLAFGRTARRYLRQGNAICQVASPSSVLQRFPYATLTQW